MTNFRFHIFLLILSLVFSCDDNSIKNEDANYGLEQISLNGTWKFMASNDIDEAKVSGSDFETWDTLEVPGNWDVENKYAHFVGKGFYQREFKIPEAWKGKQIRLSFDAVYETSKVWLNGKLLGKHEGGYTPFEFNITGQVNLGQTNSLVVMADNTFKRGAWWAWGGISRDVTLTANSDVRMVWQHITAVPDFKTNKVNFKITYKIENNSDEGKSVQIEANLSDSKTGPWRSETFTAQIPAQDSKETFISFEEDLSAVKLWHFDHPYLYLLDSEMFINNLNVHQLSDKFGIRKMEAVGEELVLNNEPVRLNGFNRVHDHRLHGNTEPYELIANDILDIKSLGGNFSRIMHAPASKKLLQFCDSIGYMIIEEIPVWGRGAPNAVPNNPRTKKWLSEMITRDFNHASVVGWSMGNEIGNSEGSWEDMTMTSEQYKYVNDMLDHVSGLDSTRLKTYVSFTSHLPLAKIGNEPYEKLDLLCMNSYGETYEKVRRAHRKFPGKPIFISEIGDNQIGLGPDSKLTDRLVDELEKIRKLPFVVGSSLWTYNDYRSNYKNTPPSENRAWGVVDVWRNKKKAFTQIQDIYAPVQTLTCSLSETELTIKLLPRKKQDVPSFILNGYVLRYQLFDGKGATISEGTIELPTIKPGDTALNFDLKNEQNAKGIRVALLSPMDIEVKTSSCYGSQDILNREDIMVASNVPAIEFLGRQGESVGLGYSVSERDSVFTIRYGNSADNLSEEINTELKGAIKIPWPSSELFFVKIKSDATEWSGIKELKK